MIKDAKIKILKMVISMLLCFAVFTIIISLVQTKQQIESQVTRAESKLEDTISVIADRAEQAELEHEEYDTALATKAEAVAYIVQNKPDYEFSMENMEKLCEIESISACWVIDRSGNVLASSDPSDKTDFSISRFAQLREGFSEGVSDPFTIEWATGSLRYCGAKIDDSRMFVIAQDPSAYYDLIESITSVESNINNIMIGSSGFVFSISKLTSMVETYPGNVLLDADAYEIGLTAENLQDGFQGVVKIDGTKYFCVTNASSSERYLLAVIPYSEMQQTNIFMVISSIIILMIATILFMAYGIIVWNNGLNHPELMDIRPFKFRKGKYTNKYILRKILPVALLIYVLVFVISYFLQTLYFISNVAVSNNEQLSSIQQTLDDYDEKAELLNENYDERYLVNCRIGAYIIEQCPQLLTYSDFDDMTDLLNVKDIYYFNTDGEALVSSASQLTFRLSEDTESQSNVFWSILNGSRSYYVQEMTIDDTGVLNQYIGVAVYDENNVVSGMLEICLSSENREFNLSLVDISASLGSIKIGNNGIVFSVEKETAALTYYPDEDLIGKDVYDLGLSESQLKDNYSDFIVLNGEKYFASSAEGTDNIVFVAVPNREIGVTKLVIVGITMIVAAVILLLLIYVLVIHNRDDKTEIKRAVVDRDEDSIYFNYVRPDGTVSTISSVESRFSLKSPAWTEKTPEQKLLTIVKVMLSVICICSAP